MTAILIIIGSIALTALLFGIPKGEKSKKTYKPKKKNWWFRDHDWKGPVGCPPDLF